MLYGGIDVCELFIGGCYHFQYFGTHVLGYGGMVDWQADGEEVKRQVCSAGGGGRHGGRGEERRGEERKGEDGEWAGLGGLGWCEQQWS